MYKEFEIYVLMSVTRIEILVTEVRFLKKDKM